MKKGFFLLSVVVLFFCCKKPEQPNMTGVVASYNNSVLTGAELDVLTEGLTPKDSAIVADRYITQWVTSEAIMEKFESVTDDDIERMVRAYRRSLYQHKWESDQVAQHMSRKVEDSIVVSFYEENKQFFVLDEAIMHGLMLVIPKGAPNLDKLREMVRNVQDEEHIEWVEKYAYQYATGYELFLDEWKTVMQVADYMPLSRSELASQVKAKKQLELQDSVNVYLLQMMDVHVVGEYKPFDYAENEIKSKILSQRQVDYIQSVREGIYNEALQQGKLKRYEK